MPTLSPSSAQALARLRAYIPPPTQYHSLPLSRRAAVLILLFADRTGELRVVLTVRSRSLNTYAGQVALPGGKADSLRETPFETARREAHEEIGLPAASGGLPPPFAVEHLCQLPLNLAKTELGVRPCVAFLSTSAPRRPSSTSSSTTSSSTADPAADLPPSVEDSLIPRLDAREVAEVFTAPLADFIRSYPSPLSYSPPPPASWRWHRGVWLDWFDTRWRMHNFYVPAGAIVTGARQRRGATERAVDSAQFGARSPPPPAPVGSEKEAKGGRYDLRSRAPPLSTAAASEPADMSHSSVDGQTFRVFGLTARILVDCARVAFGRDPEFEHNGELGDEEMVRRLVGNGRLAGEREKGSAFERGDLVAAQGGYGGDREEGPGGGKAGRSRM